MKIKFFTILLITIFVQNTFGQLNTPILQLPADGTDYVGDYVALKVNTGVSGATKYLFEIDTVEQFNSSFLLRDSSAALTYSVNILKYGFDVKYYWRAKAKNDSMESNWSNAFTFSTVDKVRLSSPDNGVEVNTISPSLSILTFGNQPSYYIEVDTLPDFSSSYLKVLYPSHSQPFKQLFNVPYGKTFYWRSWAYSGWGDTSEMSEVRTFSTPSSPKLFSPANLSTGIDTSVNYIVLNIPGSTTTEVLISDDSLFSNPTLYTSGSTFRNLKFGTTYYWKSRKAQGTNISQYSETFTFTTKFQISAPTVTLPQANAIIESDTVIVSWLSLPASPGLIYLIQIDTVNIFENPLEFYTNETQIPISNLSKEKSYYYRIRGINDFGNGAWSSVRTFQTKEKNISVLSLNSNCNLHFVSGLSNEMQLLSDCFIISNFKVYMIDGRLLHTVNGNIWNQPKTEGVFIIEATDNLGHTFRFKVGIVE